MRIIENNYNAHTEYERDCPRCNSKFAFSFGDLKMDSVTLSHYVECPCCGSEVWLKQTKETEDDCDYLPADNVQYPADFYSFAEGAFISDGEINKWIKQCVDMLDRKTDYSMVSSGDTIVFAYKADEEESLIEIVVAKKYQECEVKIFKEKF